MNNGEFYRSRENNYVGENKSFPAEEYRKPFEENSLGKELADGGEEVTTLQRTAKKPKNNKDGSAKTLIDKIFGSIKGIATAATVAVSAIVVTNTVMTNTVDVDLLKMDVGYDYVLCGFEISDLDGEDCFVVVSSAGETYSETEIPDNGVYEVRADGLKPEWEYTVAVVSRDGILGDITHFEKKFQTAGQKAEEPTPPDEPQIIPPPDVYTGEYAVPDLGNVKVDWREKTLSLPIMFEKIEDKYLYRLFVTDDGGNEIAVIERDEGADAVINIMDDVDIYKFKLEIYGVGTNEEKLVASHDVGEYDVMRPTAEVTDILLTGENLVKVDLVSSNAESITLHTVYKDGSFEDVPLGADEIARGYINLAVPDTATVITVTPIIHTDGYDMTAEPFEKTFDENLEIETLVHLNDSYMSIDFHIRAITNGAAYLHVESSAEESITGDYGFYDGMASVYYSEREQMAFTLYLTDEEGGKLSNEVSVTVDTAEPESIPDYTFNYKNPHDVGVTYNDDGTVNVYIDTDFSCADESYYYRVDLGRYGIKSRDEIAVLKGLPNESYPITYSVCFERDGVEYSVMRVTPSGVVNEVYFSESCTLSENTFSITTWLPTKLDLNGIRVTSSGGEQIVIGESDFVTTVDGEMTATVTFDESPEYVILYAMISPYTMGLESVGEYEGSIYTPIEYEVYP